MGQGEEGVGAARFCPGRIPEVKMVAKSQESKSQASDGTPRVRVRIRAEIAKGRRAGDVFLPDRLAPKLRTIDGPSQSG